ncbi:MAG: ISL3 family transposase [archaeon]
MTTLPFVLRSLFPFQGYKLCVLSCDNNIVIGLQSRRKTGTCPKCGKWCHNIEQEYERLIRDMDMAEKKCYLRIRQKKIKCKCGYRGLEKIDFITKYERVTVRLAAHVAEDCEEACLKEVARRYKLDWKTVKEIDREHIKTLLPEIAQLLMKRIAIDEIAIMKGHKYFTIIRDYDSGIAVKIVLGRGYEEVKSALLSLGYDALMKIKYASLDMWDPYIKALKECCPNIKLVFDKFHVVKKVNEALDSVRKKEFADASPQEKIDMKHKRWIILHREHNLKNEENETLKKLMEKNDRLYKAYLLKEQILSIFDEKDSTFDKIGDRIKCWLENILSNDLEEFHAVVKTIQNYMYGILNYFRYGMTNAIAEGFNTKINVLKRRAFGFRDLEYFTLKIYQNSLRRLS